MKAKAFIYGSIFFIFATFITYYLTESELIEELAIWAVVIFLGIMTLLMVVIPLSYFFRPKQGVVTIKKGKHYSYFRWMPFIYKRKMEASVLFDETVKYTGTPQLEEQINKLCGYGSYRVHKNSVRIGWRYNKKTNKVDLFEYIYKKGNLIPPVLFMSCELHTKYRVEIQSDRAFWFGSYYKPYFGGKAPAPHDIRIKITNK